MGGTFGFVQLSGARKPAKRTRKSPQELLDAVQERLDATPERLARARELGQTPTRDADRTRRIIDPFDAMRANRVLAPHDPKLNDIRWLVGEFLRRTHQRARLDQLRAVALSPDSREFRVEVKTHGRIMAASRGAADCTGTRRPSTCAWRRARRAPAPAPRAARRGRARPPPP